MKSLSLLSSPLHILLQQSCCERDDPMPKTMGGSRRECKLIYALEWVSWSACGKFKSRWAQTALALSACARERQKEMLSRRIAWMCKHTDMGGTSGCFRFCMRAKWDAFVWRDDFQRHLFTQKGFHWSIKFASSSTSSYWIFMHSINISYKIVIFLCQLSMITM